MNEQLLQRLIDRQDIVDVVNTYCRAVDRRDRELLMSVYHPDAIDDHGVMVGSREDMYEWGRLRDEAGTLEATLHHITSHTCEIDGDTAHAESYYLYTAPLVDGPVWIASGRYIDRLARVNGKWKIAVRYCLVEWSTTIERGPDPFAGLDDLHANGVPGRNREDPSYRRPLTNRRALRFPGLGRQAGRVREEGRAL
jgi:ketosteroid isomerase-like protein